MTKLQRIVKEVERLSAEELADFRTWFQSFDANLWDQQLDRDANAGKLDKLRDEALAEHQAQRTREI